MKTVRKPKPKGASLADVPYAGPPTSPASRRADVQRQRRYAAEEAMHTLMRAEEHKSNPRLMADVKRLAAESAARMGRIAKK